MLDLTFDTLALGPTGRKSVGGAAYSKFRRLVRGAFRVCNAQWMLRNCERLGARVAVRGRVRVDAAGSIQLGNRVRIHAHLSKTQLSAGPGACLSIGDDTFINHGVALSARQSVTIGRRCQIAPHVTVLDCDYHGVDDRDDGGKRAPVVIEDDVWLGTRAIVLRGVRIGKGAVVAAGAVVTKDVAPATLVAGVPAKAIRTLESNLS
jgi:acetyltransferase-like isoleucine patch superfamily enzyme